MSEKRKPDGYIAGRVLSQIVEQLGDAKSNGWGVLLIALEIEHKELARLATELIRDVDSAETLSEMLRNKQYAEAETLILQGKHRK